MLSNDDGRFDDPESDEEEILHDGLPPELQLLAKEVNGSFDDEEETLQDGLPPELQRLAQQQKDPLADSGDEDEEEETLHDGLPPELQRLAQQQKDLLADSGDEDEEEETLHDGLPPELQRLAQQQKDLLADSGDEDDDEETLHDGMPPELEMLLKDIGDDDGLNELGDVDSEEGALQDGVPEELHARLAAAESPSGTVSLVDQLKLLPFLLKASSGGVDAQLETYEHLDPYVRCDQFPQGVGCAATNGQPAWSWRVWDAAKAVAMHLAGGSCTQPVSGSVVLEMGAGAGLASLVALRLGARAVVATDLPRALPLLVHNVKANGGMAEDGASMPLATAGQRARTHPRCPGGHALSAGEALSEDHVCNVCGLEDALGAGIEKGAPVHSCRLCDFDVCGRCFGQAAAGKWKDLPGWFALQSEGEVDKPCLWRLPPPTEGKLRASRGGRGNSGMGGGGARQSHRQKRSGELLVMPWDLLGPPGDPATTETGRQTSAIGHTASGSPAGPIAGATAVVDECRTRFGAPPSLVVCADLSCSALLIQPLVDALVALRSLLPSGASAIVCHEAREAAVDAAFEAALATAEMRLEVLPVPLELDNNKRLRMWKIPLGVP